MEKNIIKASIEGAVNLGQTAALGVAAGIPLATCEIMVFIILECGS